MAMEVINHDQTRKSVTSQAQTLRSGLKNEAQAEFIFLCYQLCAFLYVIKHPFEYCVCLKPLSGRRGFLFKCYLFIDLFFI